MGRKAAVESVDTQEYVKWDKAVLVPLRELVFTDWNCNEMSQSQLAELMADIKNDGDPSSPHFDEPIQVVPIGGKEPRWLVLGGQHRTKVMSALNQEQIPCVVRWDLKDKTREELMAWTVRRNHLRGKVNAQKYVELEDAIINGGASKEAARRSMMMEDNLAEALRAATAPKPKPTKSDRSADDDVGAGREFDGEREIVEKQRGRSELLQALKIVEQDVLLDSADTVEHGYLFFVQGEKGQTHLVVNESKTLYDLVAKMVAACKGNSAKVDDFLSSAIRQELNNWE